MLRGLRHLQYLSLRRLSVHCRGIAIIARTKSSQNALLPEIPELFNPGFLDELIPAPPNRAAPTPGLNPPLKNALMDALQMASHRTLTENMAQAYDSTLSPTLDAFNTLTRFTYGEKVEESLDKAWAEDPDLTLRIIWNLRSIHDGKGEKEVFYRAFGWLYDNHPRTAITNLHLLVEPVCVRPKSENGRAHGYWKDLLNILALATVDELSNVTKPPTFLHQLPRTHLRGFLLRRSRASHTRPVRRESSELFEKQPRVRPDDVGFKLIVKAKRTARAIERHARLQGKLQDPKYRALYIAVARLFSERLISDLKLLKEFEAIEDVKQRQTLLWQLSLAAKWAPSLRGSHDRCTNISTAISRLLYHLKDALPTVQFPSALAASPSLESAEPTDILRSFYRRWVLTPLRAATLVTETFMVGDRWTEIPYTRVSSVCMKNNTAHFLRHDPEGFEKYLISVESGKKSISGATLMPHELVAQVMDLSKHHDAVQLRVMEAQWKTLVQNLRDAGTIENAIAVCDVSASMGFLSSFSSHVDPIFPAVSLSLLLAQLAAPPFNGGFITFSNTPRFVRLDLERSLYDTVSSMGRADWGMNTNLNAVFLKLILPLAVKNKLKQEDMIKRLFIFSDMQFDQAARPRDYGLRSDWETNYDVIEKAYAAAGYAVPQIVYWNLSGYTTVEVAADRKGVAMMSGFSPSMLKVFMGEEALPEEEVADEGAEETADEVAVKDKVEEEEFNPLNVMKKALSRESYARLVVVD